MEEIKGMLNAESVFDHVTAEDIAEEWWKDPILCVVCPHVTAGDKLKPSVIAKLN